MGHEPGLKDVFWASVGAQGDPVSKHTERVQQGQLVYLLHSLLVVSEALQLPLGPLRELLEDLLPPGSSLGGCDGQGQRLH